LRPDPKQATHQGLPAENLRIIPSIAKPGTKFSFVDLTSHGTLALSQGSPL